MEFEFLIGDVNWEDYGGKWVSPPLHNGDWPYWLVIEFINFLDATGEQVDGCDYVVEISAVSPEAAGKDNIARAIESYGIDNTEVSDVVSDEALVEALSSYGISAHLWSETGNDADKLLAAAKHQADLVAGLFGFFMDRPENRIGSTGWDFIAGDIMAGLKRM